MKQMFKQLAKRVIKKCFRIFRLERLYYNEIAPSVVQEQPGRAMVDVLFINGCDLSVPHPPRYRVSHQREQLEANNITTDEIFYTQVMPDDVKYANAFIIFRCPYTDVIGNLIIEAKRENKPVWFDVDDLVIDTKYTDLIPYVQQLDEEGKKLYDDGVNRMGKTLAMCDAAITTTKALADELRHYVPEVFINRNTASDEMYRLSLEAQKNKQVNYHEDVVIDEDQQIVVPKREEGEVRIGYFSGSITHNQDVEMIMDALVNVLDKHKNVKFYVVGELDLPEQLKRFSGQIICFPFMDWRCLPRLISMVDINLAPLADGIFNRAKSENKWVEAALVKVVTLASNVGAFREMIIDGETGVLCEEDQWFDALEDLVINGKKRNLIVEKAYEYVKKYCLTIYSGQALAKYVKDKIEHTAILILPSTEISGGINVALKHLEYIKSAGYIVTVLAHNPSLSWIDYSKEKFPVVSWKHDDVRASFEKGIATMWTTTEFLENTDRVKEKYYLVQNYETDFYEPNNPCRRMANRTYSLPQDIMYVTISKWCQKWLLNDYKKNAEYVPNGLNRDQFPRRERTMDGRIRILIEGDSSVDYKGVDESFSITNSLNREKYEIWYMSYNGQAKAWYHVDKFLHRIPYDEVGDVYRECDILLKSSWLESFSYPPLEMMATDGFVVAVKNGGNAEFLKDEYNCLFYEQGNIEDGLRCIERLVNEKDLRIKLLSAYDKTVETRDWKNIREKILRLYHIM